MPRSCLLSLALLLVTSRAGADAVPPEPRECPPSTRPTTGHGGPSCTPRYCTTDGECEAGEACRSAELRIPSERPADFDWERPGFPIVVPRAPGCLEPEMEVFVCVDSATEVIGCNGGGRAGSEAAPPPRGGCASCRASPRGRLEWTTLAVLVAFVLLPRRRARIGALFAIILSTASACGAPSEPAAATVIPAERAPDPEPEVAAPDEPDEEVPPAAGAVSQEARALHDTLLRAARGDASAAERGVDVGELEWVTAVNPPLYATEDDVPDGTGSGCVCLPESHRCDLIQPGGVTSVHFTGSTPPRITRIESEEP